MKLLIVRLLIPPWNHEGLAALPSQTAASNQSVDPETTDLHPASQGRALLALHEREAAAIQIHCTTMAPQTAYSTPALAWRPGGTGVWVNSDDGVIRGIEASTGKVVATLKGHEPGSKIRCLCAGLVEAGDSTEEWLVSGGFDHKLIIWKPEE